MGKQTKVYNLKNAKMEGHTQVGWCLSTSVGQKLKGIATRDDAYEGPFIKKNVVLLVKHIKQVVPALRDICLSLSLSPGMFLSSRFLFVV
jgi:hypothetical protein